MPPLIPHLTQCPLCLGWLEVSHLLRLLPAHPCHPKVPVLRNRREVLGAQCPKRPSLDSKCPDAAQLAPSERTVLGRSRRARRNPSFGSFALISRPSSTIPLG